MGLYVVYIATLSTLVIAMKIIANSFAVFWTRPGWKQQFMADVGGFTDPVAAVAWFKTAYPEDVVCSIRDRSGRFLPFAVV